MRIGLALPHRDGSGLPDWSTVTALARRAEDLGFASIWVDDHLPGYDPLVALGALARRTTRVGLGLALDAGRRPATVLAKALATVDVVSGGRLIVGLGAGDEAPEEGPARLAETVEVLRGMWDGGPYRFEGRHQRAFDARCLPRPVQREPGPPVWLAGSGDGILGAVARCADGWGAVGPWTPAAYRERVAVLHRACEGLGRDPASVTLLVALPALVGEGHADLSRRFERLRRLSPSGKTAGVTLDDWRRGRLVGTVEEVRRQLDGWAAMGVSTVVVAPAAALSVREETDDLGTVAAACSLEPCRTSDPWN